VDNTPPVVANTTIIPSQQLPFGNVNISTSAYDNYLLSEVWIDIRDPNSNSIGNVTMGYDSSSDLFYSDGSYNILGVHHFCIWASDSSNNWESFCGQFAIDDYTPPVISDVAANPDPQEILGTVNISAVVVDNYLIVEVDILIQDPTGFTIGNFSMQFDGDSGVYFYEIIGTMLGTYSFDIWAKDGGGNWASSVSSFDIRDTTPPEANAGVDREVMYGVTVSFDGSGSTDNYAIETYEWTFDDGIEYVVLNGVSPQHTFQEAGLYMVTLTVTDSSGNSDQDTVYVNVIGEKVPNAPEGLMVVEIGDDFIRLTWTAPTTNTDGSELTDLKGCNIYRSAQSGGPYVKIATLITLSESYLDRNLDEGFVGYYVVTAYNSEGVESAYSNEAWGLIPKKGSISGRIVDEEGDPVPGALIELEEDGTRVTAVQTNEKGNFTIVDIDDGGYEIVITKTSFETYSEKIIILNGSQVVIGELTIKSLPEPEPTDLPFFEMILVVTIVVVIVAIALFAVRKRSKKRE
jgi:PKD repeat protein